MAASPGKVGPDSTIGPSDLTLDDSAKDEPATGSRLCRAFFVSDASVAVVQTRASPHSRLWRSTHMRSTIARSRGCAPTRSANTHDWLIHDRAISETGNEVARDRDRDGTQGRRG